MTFELSRTPHETDMLPVQRGLSEVMYRARLLKIVHEDPRPDGIRFYQNELRAIRSLTQRDDHLQSGGISLKDYFVLHPDEENARARFDSIMVTGHHQGRAIGRTQKQETFEDEHVLSRMVSFVSDTPHLQNGRDYNKGRPWAGFLRRTGCQFGNFLAFASILGVLVFQDVPILT